MAGRAGFGVAASVVSGASHERNGGPSLPPSMRSASLGAPGGPVVSSHPVSQGPPCWPFISSHYREWLFSPEQLKEKRATVHAKALKRLEEVDPTVAADAPSADELLVLQQYFALQLLLIFQKKGLKAYALETACLFFHRFFLSVSPLEVDVRLVLFACLLLALKAIDVARHYTLGELLGDIEDLDLGAVVALELPVCEGLHFQLLTLHTREPLNELMSVLIDHVETQHQQQQQQQQENTPDATTTTPVSSSNGSRRNSNSSTVPVCRDDIESQHLSLLGQLVRLQEDAEASCLLMHASPSLPLRHPPCQLALAGLLASPIRRDLLQRGFDVESILKRHLLALTAQTPEMAAAAAPAADEDRWLLMQKCVEAIVAEVRAIRQTQKQTQGNTFSQTMADLLGKAIDAAEALEAQKRGDGDSRREKKKRKKQRKMKKE